MNTQEIIKNLIQSLYERSLQNGFNFRFSRFDGSDINFLRAADGTFLGSFSSKYNANSIFNKYGNYGSKYFNESIFNKYGNYGSKYSSLSPFNKYTQEPPSVFVNNQFVGYLTVNKFLPNNLPTDVFLFYCFKEMEMLDERIDDLVELVSRID